MAARTASRPPARARQQTGKVQSGTDVRTSGQNLAYYREGSNRSLQARGYTAARKDGQTILATPRGNQVSLSAPDKTYHRYILAEFIACLMMIAGGMILIPAQGASEGGLPAAGRSFARQLVQLTALCMVFFILALAGSGPKTGKVAAAFGGLVTLGVAWNLSEMWAGLARALGGQTHVNTAPASSANRPVAPAGEAASG